MLLDQFLRLRVLPEFDCFDETVLELLRQAVGGFHLDVGVPDADQVSDQLTKKSSTMRSVELRIVLKASIFQRAKSPGNSSPNMERADMILMELSMMTL